MKDIKYKSEDYVHQIRDSIDKTKSMNSAFIYFCEKYIKINSKTFRRMVKDLNLWETNISGKGMPKDNSHRKFAVDDVLSNKLYLQSNKLRKRLIKEGYKENKCEVCNLTSWMGNEMPLELHHIDGNKNNNSIDNLMIVCPNCHTFTNTYKGKNIKKV